ncbi:MAG: glutamine amidotransferase [Gammaproteobacteria bacterium]
MGKRALLIRHVRNKRNDRLSHYLLNLGYALEWCCPVNGDRLPKIDGHHQIAVVYGGIQSANDGADRPYIRQEIDWIARWVSQGLPFLGICLGAQLLARALGARVELHPLGLAEVGYVMVRPTAGGRGFMDFPQPFYEWHREGFEVPQEAELVATGDVFPNQAFRFREHVYGLQFHPEVTPEIILAWMGEAPKTLDYPGAHCRGRQVLDMRRFDRCTSLWLVQFLTEWLGATDVDEGDGRGGLRWVDDRLS